MRIDSGTLGMDSARLYRSSSASFVAFKRGSVSAQGNEDAFSLFSDLLTNGEEQQTEEEKPEEAPKGNRLLYENLRPSPVKIPTVSINRDTGSQFRQLHELMIKRIFQLLFGGKGKCHEKNNELQSEEAPEEYVHTGSMFRTYRLVETEFTSAEYFAETEVTTFNAGGVVKTSDGREIDVNLSVNMSRSFAEYYESKHSVSNLQVCDPLVINFDGNLAGLSKNLEFYFDLDTDGEAEKIAGLSSGSGFLALDLNGDGKINDGSELFGTKSGNGFEDLAKYDEDGDGWIDEDDSVFEKLKIWVKDEKGNDVLYSLKDKNIGAIYTGAARTDFSLNDDNNMAMGYVRQTGVFLYEDGGAGTVQHIDLVS